MTDPTPSHVNTGTAVAKPHVSFAVAEPNEYSIGSAAEPSSNNYGGLEVTEVSNTSERGVDEPPVVMVKHHVPILNHHRRTSLQKSRSLGRSSVRDLARALARHPSVMSIYSPLEARRVDGGLPPRSLTCVVMNLISAGYILLPYAFAQAGVLLSSAVLLLVVLQTYISGNFLLVAGAHAEALNNHKSLGGTLPVNYSFALRNRKYEVSHLYRIFMTRIEAAFFTLTTIGDLYGITWALISIFAATLAEGVPVQGIDLDSYKLYLLSFVCFALPMSCTSVIDQVWVQLVFLFLRMVMVLCMLITIFAAIGKTHFGDLEGPIDDIPLADFRQIVPVIMTSIFSTAYQFSVPCIAASSENIKTVPKVFQTATTFVYASNILVAIFISFYFGRDGTLASSNLLWNNYHGGGGGDDAPWWASAISSYVTLFAAIDGAAVYPLIAIALGDILMGTVYGDNVHEAEENWKIRICFRFLGAVPQALGAIFVSDLSVIATFAGICTLLSYTTAPALLFLHSRHSVRNAKIPVRTHYSTRLSSPVMAVVNIVVSLIIIGAVVADNLL